MSIVFACAGSHAPGIRAWTEQAPEHQVKALFSGWESLREAMEDAKPDTILLLTSEHWANFFLDHISPFCVGRAESFTGPIEPWLRVESSKISGDPILANSLLEYSYANDFEPGFSYEMALDHGTMVPLSFLTPRMDIKIVPIMFNTLAPPRPTTKRCLSFGRTLAEVLRASDKRIAVVATGGLSHDPGERNHGFIDQTFDRGFLKYMTEGNLEALGSYTDADLLAAGSGTLELLAWISLAGLMGARPARTVCYEPVTAWAAGMGMVIYDNPG